MSIPIKLKDITEYTVNPWNIKSLKVFPEKNEVWFGSWMDGIYICDLQMMQDMAVPFTSIEDDIAYNPMFPVIMKDKIYPLPSYKGYTNVSFYQQLGTIADLEIEIFDINGTKINKAQTSVENILGIHRRVKIATSNLAAGVYICRIKYNEHSATAKFIVD